MQKDPISGLIQLGFSENDARVYLALTELKSATANPLIAKTGLHRSLVYTALEHLVSRKLISSSEVKGKKHFSITSPAFLIEEFNQKKDIAEEVAAFIDTKLNADDQEITIHQGNDEYLQLLSGLIKKMPRGSTKYVLGTGGETFMKYTMRPIWKKYHEVATAQGIKIKMIAYDRQKVALEKDTSPMGIYNICYLPDTTENPAGIHIYPEINTILNIIYSDEFTPVTAIRIKNKALSESYLKLFNHLWEQK